jgi:UTP--glucose-1-phosphate uridylyltransferase
MSEQDGPEAAARTAVAPGRTGPVTKAVIPAAGMGTRFLPASKAVPKELLPIVDTPAIEYVVAEAASVGARDVLMITGRGKAALEEHFDRNAELERALEAKGDLDRLAKVRRSTDLATIHYVRQGDPLGLGHAVLCAAEHVGWEPFAVLLGDDLIDPRDPLLSTMIEVRERFGGSVIALMEVPKEQINLYGCAAVLPIDDSEPDVVLVTALVEKPPVDEAPSNLAIIGRYLLDPSVFDVLRQTQPGRGGEIQLTDALQHLAVSKAAGAGVRGVIFRGRRYDTGDRMEYLKAVVRLASEHPELGDEFRSWLGGFAASTGSPASAATPGGEAAG